MFKATSSVISTLLLTYNSIYTKGCKAQPVMKKRQISFLCVFFNGFLHQPAQILSIIWTTCSMESFTNA